MKNTAYIVVDGIILPLQSAWGACTNDYRGDYFRALEFLFACILVTFAMFKMIIVGVSLASHLFLP